MGLKVIFKIPSAQSVPSMPTLSMPYISVSSAGYVVISAQSGAAIYYTTDGSTPTAASARYAGPFMVSGSGTVRAIAMMSGYNNSAVATQSYSIASGGGGGDNDNPTNPPQSVAQPNITVDVSGGNVTLYCPTAGARIYYTLDGSTPSAASLLYAGSFRVSGSGTIKAVAVLEGVSSSVATQTYNITGQTQTVATPAITVDNTTGNVSIACATSGATIYFTTDGSTPATAPNASTSQYTYGFNVAEHGPSCTVKAIAVKDGYTPSQVATASYNAAPVKVATPVIDYAESSRYVSISCTTPSSTIHFTTDGSTPTAGSTAFVQPFIVHESCTVKAIAVKTGCTDSDIATKVITVTQALPQVQTPVITVDLESGFATITCATAGAQIHYTLDGSAPTRSSALYSGPVDTAGATEVRAMAVLDGAPDSQTASALVSKSAVSGEMTSGYYLNTSGQTARLDGWKYTDYIPVPPGATKVTGSAHIFGMNSQLLNFYDESQAFISGTNALAETVGHASYLSWGSVDAAIPAGAKYVRYCSVTADSAAYGNIDEDYRTIQMYFER